MKIFTSNSLLLLLQNLKTKLDGKSDTSHTHDNRYYTESEIDTKLNGKSDTSHTHNYAGSSSAGGAATTATKLGTSTVGGTTTPIYLNNGTPTALGYTIAKSVPSDAKFTDTTYSVATSTKDGLMSAADKKLFDYTNNQLETDLDNLLDKPAESIADIIYPVGSIYMSVNSVNPGALFGGTWEKVSGQTFNTWKRTA